MLRFIGTELQNPSRFRQRRGPWAHGAPLGGRRLLSAGRDTLAAGCSFALSMASWRPWSFGCRGLSRDGWGGGRVGAGQEQSQRGGGRGTSVWAGVRGVGPGPGWMAPGSALAVTEARWRWTARHLAVLPGPGAPRGLRAARSSGWASAGLPGCLLRSDAAAT